MLLTLNIKNAALIEDLTLNIDEGMTVLTGETGAGKSIIIDSINLIMGARTDKTIVRYGEKKTVIQAVFSFDGNLNFEEYGIDADDTVIINREISADGKSICRVNGVIVPQAFVREITENLINIHGQHDNQALLVPSKHIDFLDRYAKNEELLAEYGRVYEKKLYTENKIKSLLMDEAEKIRKIDLLSYQVDEIDKAHIRIGEKETLIEERLLIRNSEKISSSLNETYEFLYNGDKSVYDQISSACESMSKISELDDGFGEIYQKISDMKYAVEDVSRDIYSNISKSEYSENDLNALEERLDTIMKLERKYGGSEEAILDYCEKSRKELEEISDCDAENSRLTQELDLIKKELSSLAEKLTEKRRKAGADISTEIERELSELDMPKVRFNINIDLLPDFSLKGVDKVEFMISPNPGEPEKPLDKIASGGELSRVMLAIKTILADSDNVDTLIFDEVDTGVSGSAARKIAVKMSALSRKKQVICVSHQPQLAAAADNHYNIRKYETEGRNITVATLLNDDDRVMEIAKIIDGENINDTSKEHARQMIDGYRREG